MKRLRKQPQEWNINVIYSIISVSPRGRPLCDAEGELRQEHLPSSGVVHAGARGGRWISDRQSQGSAGEGKEPSGALLNSHEELEHYDGECGGLV